MLPYFCEMDKIDSELYSKHTDIVVNIFKLIKELNLNNIHEIFYVFCYLLWNGYFSIDKKYVYNSVDIINENNTIFLGRGCCRHNSSLLQEVLKYLDMYSREMTVNLSKFTKLKNRMEIKREIESFVEEKTLYSLHSDVLCLDKSQLFILDPTNLVECEVIKNGKITCFNGRYLVSKKLLKKELDRLLWYSYEFNTKNTIDKNILNENYRTARDICLKNVNLLDDFYDENHRNYSDVKKLVLSDTIF